MIDFGSWAESLAPYVGYLIPLPVILPMLAAAICFICGKRTTAQRQVAFFTLLAIIVVNSLLLLVADWEGIQTLQIGGWDAPVGITLVADRLAALMLTTSSVILFAVVWYAISQGIHDDGNENPVAVFLPSYMLLTMGVNLSFLAGDLFNLYVGFEIFLSASYVLLTLGATPSRVRAGVGYVMVSMASSMIFLIALAMVYAAVGTMNMAQIGERLEDIPGGVSTAIFAVLLVAFGIKAAVVPLDAWLPDSYPTAPSLVTAVFAGLLTKVGVYAIIRMRSLVFTDGRLDTLLMWVGLATMIVGILGAMVQPDIKRLLSFTLVSHIGYMIFGLALGSPLGLSGAIFYAIHHILVQTALFLVVGLIEHHTGTASLRQLGSLLYTAPTIAVLYFIPAINLGGIPPFSGFLGKVLLLQAAAEKGTWLAWVLAGGAVLTSLLTLYVMMLVWSKGFLRDRADAPDAQLVGTGEIKEENEDEAAAEQDDTAATGKETSSEGATASRVRGDKGRPTPGMVASTAMLVIASTSLTFVAGPMASITGRAAESVQDTSVYRYAVLGDTGDNPTRHLDSADRYQKSPDSLQNREGGTDGE